MQEYATPHNVILGLKIAVAAVTVLLVASLAALGTGRPKLHGYINRVFFLLTIVAVLGFEVIIRFVNPDLSAGFTAEAKESLQIHLCFSIPAAIMLPAMLYTGQQKLIKIHVPLAIVFLILWGGTFITGMFFLPHDL